MTPKARAQQIVDDLNEALLLDPVAITELMTSRVRCNEALGGHPTIQVGADGGELRLGPLGLINGLVGVRDNGWGYIAMELDRPDGLITRFFVLGPEGKTA